MAKDNPFSDNPFNKSEVGTRYRQLTTTCGCQPGAPPQTHAMVKLQGFCIVVCKGLMMQRC